MSRYVTLKQLHRKYACDRYTDLFRELFGPNGKVKITEQTCAILAPYFNMHWAIENLLTEKQEKVYRATMKKVPGYIIRVLELRALIHDFDAYSATKRDILNTALHDSALTNNNRDMVRAFAAAYNSPRK